MHKQSFIYHEPSLPTLLVLIAFLFFLQFGRYVAQKIFSAGLLGEIAVGIIFGSPLANLLGIDWQATFLAIGYLGLILIVFEGTLASFGYQCV